MKPFKIILAALAITVLPVVASAIGHPTGPAKKSGISGTVVGDENELSASKASVSGQALSGVPIQGTEVGLEHEPSGIVTRSTTSKNGNVNFSHLEAGSYAFAVLDTSRLKAPAEMVVSFQDGKMARGSVVSAPILPTKGSGRAYALGTDGQNLTITLTQPDSEIGVHVVQAPESPSGYMAGVLNSHIDADRPASGGTPVRQAYGANNGISEAAVSDSGGGNAPAQEQYILGVNLTFLAVHPVNAGPADGRVNPNVSESRVVAKATTDAKGQGQVSLPPGDYELDIDGPSWAAAMDKLSPAEPKKKKKNKSSFSFGIGVGGGERDSRDDGGAVQGGHDDSRSSHGGGMGGGVGLSIPLGGDDTDKPTPAENPITAITITLPPYEGLSMTGTDTVPAYQFLNVAIPYCRDAAVRGMSMRFTVPKGGSGPALSEDPRVVGVSLGASW